MSDFENENNVNNNEPDSKEKNGKFSGFFKKKTDVCEASAMEDMSEEDIRAMKHQKIIREIVSWILCIAIAIGAAYVIRTWLFTVVKVDGNSMLPTLHHGERLVVRIVGYEPTRGDIVILNPKSDPNKVYVKRVIATGGDRIWIDQTNGEVHLKKKGSDEWEILDEKYILDETYIPSYYSPVYQKYDNSGEEGMLINEGHIFVMGDNRNNSNDSRNESYVGQVKNESVIGKVVLRWWPLKSFKSF